MLGMATFMNVELIYAHINHVLEIIFENYLIQVVVALEKLLKFDLATFLLIYEFLSRIAKDSQINLIL